MQIKCELRILGIDDGHFSKQDKDAIVIGTVFRGGKWMDGVLSTHVKIDGYDSTENLIHLVRKSKHFGQLRCIMINGIALGGFNVIDINSEIRQVLLEDAIDSVIIYIPVKMHQPITKADYLA